MDFRKETPERPIKGDKVKGRRSKVSWPIPHRMDSVKQKAMCVVGGGLPTKKGGMEGEGREKRNANTIKVVCVG